MDTKERSVEHVRRSGIEGIEQILEKILQPLLPEERERLGPLLFDLLNCATKLYVKFLHERVLGSDEGLDPETAVLDTRELARLGIIEFLHKERGVIFELLPPAEKMAIEDAASVATEGMVGYVLPNMPTALDIAYAIKQWAGWPGELALHHLAKQLYEVEDKF